MILRSLSLSLVTLAVLPAASGLAATTHTVQPGDTLWSIAAAHNLTTRTVAAFNGLPDDAAVVLGSSIRVPTVQEGAAALAARGTPDSAPAGASPGIVTPSVDAAPAGGGAHIVQAGETLSGIAARTGVPIDQLAALNGVAPDSWVFTGSPLRLPGAGSPTAGLPPAPGTSTPAGPSPTGARVDGARVAQIAAEHGVPGSLAAAIGWQESGFNNAMVSSANARGVMQVIPGTWNWIQSNLADRTLDPNSAEDNVRAGSLFLRHLLRETGGDLAMAAAGYYQGLRSVRDRGMYDDTKRYVDNVLALRSRFGG